jgi:disulfide bond formation protein DsbB
MILRTRRFSGAILAASIAVLGAALLSQYWGGLFPCELCLLQRWPWWIAIVLSSLAVLVGDRMPLQLAALALGIVFLVSVGFAAYHVGVEQHWLAGPTACTAGPGGAATVDDLRRQLLGRHPVMCDQVQWSLFGVSLAGWNLIASLIVLIGCAMAAWRAKIGA